jgi:uncharacterized damage-inducible protein DinB
MQEAVMNETTMRELMYGKGAHADPVACIDDLSAELAATRGSGYPHSIWQIVLHMNYWMDYELAKIAGRNPRNPEHAIESWPEHSGFADELEWQAARQHFIDGLARFAALAESDPAALDRTVTDFDTKQQPRQSTVRTVLWQIIAHNSYHAGQIALLRRQAGAWPPERGGDTW